MKNSRMKKVVTFGLAALLLLGGCGEVPYELTESEESLIVNYASNAVAKFNIKQKDGLTYVDLSQLDKSEETEEPEDTQTVEDTETAQEPSAPNGAEPVSEDPDAPVTKTLQDVFGAEGLSVNYAGYELSKSYVAEDYFALDDAGQGKIYLVLNIDLTNNSAGDITVDHLVNMPSLQVSADGMTSTVETTFLLNDFSTYQGVISPAQTVRTVLLFQVDETVTSVTELSLNTTINGEKVTIIL